VSGERGNGKVFTFLQDYLDGSVLIHGAYCGRRAVLLAVHDMKDRQEAPPALQRQTLSKLDLLKVRPVTQVIFYDDIATAILRMEVVIRLEAMQARVESKLGTPPAQHIVDPSGGVGGSSSPATANIRFLGRAPTWAPLVFVTILVVLFAQVDNKVRSSARTALDHSRTKAGCERWAGMPCEMHSGSWTAAEHNRAEAAEFRGQFVTLAGEEQTMQQLEKSPIYRPSLLMQSVETMNDSRSRKEPLPERTFQSEPNALDHKLANQSAVPLFATNVEESISGAKEGMREW
jgi:hypothetical protein